ncbi:MAG: toprim domain-containing protein [Rubrivivax sp.]
MSAPSIIDWHGPRRQAHDCGGGHGKPLVVWAEDGNAYCHRCAETFYRDEREPRAPRPVQLVHRVDDVDRWKRDRSIDVWAASRQITAECLVAPYFAARGVPLPPVDGDLRWLQDLRLFGFSGPALVGGMSPATDHRERRGVHLTWLQNGPGGWRRQERRYLGPKKGCVVRLWPEEDVSAGLAIGEGLETMLALAHAYRPCWAALDAGNLAEFPLLAGIESLLIAADHDDAGIKAAEACAARWAAAGREASIALPARAKADINDLAVAA